MRDFYKSILQNLYIYCGNRQVDKMEDAEITILLDALCRMSSTIYGYITEEQQKAIITACLITDKEYQNINVRTVSKWLDQNGKIFFKEEAHKEKPSAPPLEGEERDKMIETLLNEIAKADNKFSVKPVSNAELMREKLHGANAEPTNYIPDPRVIEEKKRHLEYIKANYAPDGNCLETWIPEDEWLKLNYPEI